MKCPMLPEEHTSAENPSATDYADCLREECAWWNPGESQCAVLSLAEWQPHIINALKGMTHDNR